MTSPTPRLAGHPPPPHRVVRHVSRHARGLRPAERLVLLRSVQTRGVLATSVAIFDFPKVVDPRLVIRVSSIRHRARRSTNAPRPGVPALTSSSLSGRGSPFKLPPRPRQPRCVGPYEDLAVLPVPIPGCASRNLAMMAIANSSLQQHDAPWLVNPEHVRCRLDASEHRTFGHSRKASDREHKGGYRPFRISRHSRWLSSLRRQRFRLGSGRILSSPTRRDRRGRQFGLAGGGVTTSSLRVRRGSP